MDANFELLPKVEQPNIAQGIELLDSLEPIPEDKFSKPVAIDVFNAAAEVGEDQISEITKEEVAGGPIQEGPKTFEEMLDTGVGNFLQRAAKAYIKPRNPEQTIKLMKALQVDRFQDAAIGIMGIMQLIKKALRINLRTQTNYSLGDNSLSSMVDFATNKTTFNEAVHLVAAGIFAASILPTVATGRVDASLALNTGVFLVNTYCVLGQRYARARLSMVIDHALKRHREFDANRYRNALGIKVPGQDKPNL